jgi:hypothetical protein
MPNELQMFVFTFEGSTELHPLEPSIEGESIGTLNEHADEVAKRLEKEIGRFFRASMSVQAEVRFYEGSLLVEGTVILLGYLGSLALAAGRKTFEAQFSNVIEIATQRVMQWAFRTLIPQANAEPMRHIEVTPQTMPLAEPTEEQRPAATSVAQQQPVSGSPPAAVPAQVAPTERNLYWLTIGNTILLLIVVVIELALVFSLTLSSP